MDVKSNDTVIRNMSFIYFGIAFLAVLNEYNVFESSLLLSKYCIVPVLLFLYFYCSKKRNVIYILALLFSFLTNVFFMEPTNERFFYGQVSFALYILLMVVLVFKIIKETRILSLIIAIIPFLSIFSYLLVLIENTRLFSFYISVLDVILMSLMGGVSVSSYVFNDNKKNSFLLISSLFFTTLIFVFTIQKYFSFNEILQPITIVIYSVSNYIFFRFMIEDEIEVFVLEMDVQE